MKAEDVSKTPKLGRYHLFQIQSLLNLYVLPSSVQKFHFESVLGSIFGVSYGLACGRDNDLTDTVASVPYQYADIGL